MKIEEVVEYFGHRKNFEETTGMNQMNLYQWRKRGYIPIVSQYRIQHATNGDLEASVEHTPMPYGSFCKDKGK